MRKYIAWIVLLAFGIGCTSSNRMPRDITITYPKEKIELGTYVDLKFKLYKTGHLRIDGVINGVVVKFLIDTGSSKSFLTDKISAQTDLKVLSSTETATGIGSTARPIKLCMVPRLGFYDFIIRKWNFGILDLGHINSALANAQEEHIDGIIGADILNHFNCIIDYKNEKIYFQLSNSL